jgi:DNA modification methylase
MAKRNAGKKNAAKTDAPLIASGKNWRNFDPELTQDLWLIPARDKSGEHIGDYHGNFVPQIANRLMLRFTRPGDCVLDPFAGSGTTLIECRRMGRHGLGLELCPEICALAKERSIKEPNPFKVTTRVQCVDSSSKKASSACGRFLKSAGRESFDLLILHPPYSDIIKFSDDCRDLSSLNDPDAFADAFMDVYLNLLPKLKDDGFIGVVIGDKYDASEVIPLGSILIQRILSDGNARLKGVVVKDIQHNRAKRNLDNLWRYRALKGGFFIFKHEYVLVFQKHKSAFFGKDTKDK